MIRISLLALAIAAATAGTATADDIAPMAGKTFALNAASGAIYYTKEIEGFRVVATINGAEGAAPLRFVATLADGQGVTLSVPVASGAQPQDLQIRRTGDALSVVGPERPDVRASLD